MNAKQYKQQRDELIAAVQRALGFLNNVHTGDEGDASLVTALNILEQALPK